ncbi:MAG: RNA polymerase sigma factor [Myxococcota bacterium]
MDTTCADSAATDEALMAAVSASDRRAFDVLFARWRDPIWKFLLRRLGSAAVADDAFQDTWARVWRFRASYDPKRAFRAWVYTLAANAGRDQWSRPVPEDFAEDLVDDRDRVGAKLTLLKALFALEGLDRTILLLVAEGFEPSEIAPIVGMDAGAVRTRLSRARQKIRELV